MKFNMDAARAKFGQWLIVSIISGNTKADPEAEQRFEQLINAPGYDSAKLDLKLMVNGLTFDLMDDTLEAVEKHIDDEIEERSRASASATKKMEALRILLDMGDEDIEEFINGN